MECLPRRRERGGQVAGSNGQTRVITSRVDMIEAGGVVVAPSSKWYCKQDCPRTKNLHVAQAAAATTHFGVR
jgi:hypothetical protein